MDRLPPFAESALLLDLDGTLIELAPTPDSVVVPPGLTAALSALHRGLGGALAIVTGRPIEAVDRLLGGAVGTVAGEHGGALRPAAGAPIERPGFAPPPEAWLDAAQALADRHPGALLERKARGFGLHYRLAPEAGPAFRAALAAMAAADPAFQLLQGHMLWELRPDGADKGSAVAELMRRAPFAGRRPVFIGDDVTDEDGMREARRLGGAGYRVDAVFGAPQGVRDWLLRSSNANDWAAL